MSRTIKFSDFSLPTNGTTDLYLVGYVEGEENTNVKISANDLSFSASGSAGVSSINGKNGLVQIQGEKGVSITENGNILTISGQNITIDQTFNGSSQNPQSGVAIATQLENVAKTDTSITFKDDLIVWGDADLKWIYGQGMTINGTSTFNGSVIIEGRNVSDILGSVDSHIADYFIHVTNENKEHWNNKADIDTVEMHTSDTIIHTSQSDKERWDKKADGDTLNAHLENKDVHITEDEKTVWNNKADVSDITQHSENSNIHVTEEDKINWNKKIGENDLYTITTVTPKGGTEDNANIYGFVMQMPIRGIAKSLSIECRHTGSALPANTPIWCKIWKGTTYLTKSRNSQIHNVNAILRYEFEDFDVEPMQEYRVTFHTEDGLATTAYQMGIQCCCRVVSKGGDEIGGLLNSSGGYFSQTIVAKYNWEILASRYVSLNAEEQKALIQLLNNKDTLMALLSNNA